MLDFSLVATAQFYHDSVFVNEALLCSLVGLEKEAKLKQRNKLKRTKREKEESTLCLHYYFFIFIKV